MPAGSTIVEASVGRMAYCGSAVTVLFAPTGEAEFLAIDSRQAASFKAIEITSSKSPKVACQSNSTRGCEDARDAGEGSNP